MSMYRDGVIGDAVTSANRLSAANTGLQSDLKKVVKQFPTAMTAVQIERQLDQAVRYGKAKRASLGKGATRGLDIAISNAEKTIDFWHPRATQMYVFKRNQNKEWQDTYNQVMRIYVEVAGLTAETNKLQEAKETFKEDVNPTTPTNLLKIALIGGAAYFGFRLIKGKLDDLASPHHETEE